MKEFTGYGVDLSTLVFKNLDVFMKKYSPDVYETMTGNLKENGTPLSDSGILDWLDDYENGGYHGLSAYLACVIDDQENLSLSVYDSIPNGYLCLCPDYPWMFDAATKELTLESLNGLLKTYLSQISDLSGITEGEIITKSLIMYCDYD